MFQVLDTINGKKPFLAYPSNECEGLAGPSSDDELGSHLFMCGTLNSM